MGLALPRSTAARAVVVALGVAFAAAEAREISRGARAVAACDAARLAHDDSSAIARAREAAEARAPGSPYSEAGFDRLAAIAQEAEARNDVATAESTYRAMRRAAEATRALGSAQDDHRRAAESGLARLAARVRPDAPLALPPPRAEEVQAMLAADDRPRPLAYLALGAGALLLFGGAFVALGRPDFRAARLAWAVSAVGLALLALTSVR